jgi:diguanylate cyclase (GGDEF)-like protein/PAS domain S-box-containing protein
MRPSWATVVRYIRNGIEPILLLVAIVVLRRFDLAGDVSLWIIAAVLLFGTVFQLPEVQLWLSGGDLTRRVWPRVGLQILTITAIMYMTGWGALLGVAHVYVLSVHLRQSGSRVWRPAVVSSVLAIGLGQIAYTTGFLYSYLPIEQTNVIALLIALGTATTAHTLGRAVALREEAEATVRRNEVRYRALVRDGFEVIMEARADGNVTYVSPAALPVLGYRPEQLLGPAIGDLIHPDDLAKLIDLHRRVLASDGTAEISAEVRYRHADGTWRWHELITRNMLAHSEVHAIIVHHRDITERRLVQDGIAHAAAHDDLTGLANAPTLQRDLENALAQGTRYQHTVGLLFLDLDGFKQVNDTFGHEVGDELLRTISAVIRRTIRDTDSAGRLGGDEFGVVLSRVAGADEALAVAARIIRGIQASDSLAGLKLDIGCSVGVAIANPGGTDAKTLLRHADAAMYQTKRRGRNGAQLYLVEDVTAPWLI